MQNKNSLNWPWWKWVLITVYMFMYPVVFLWLAGDWFWFEGWLFGGYMFLVSFVTTVYLYIKDPALLKERMKRPGADNTKGWDKYWLYIFILLFLGWFVIMPLDAVRFEWSETFPVWVKWVGGFLHFPAFYFLFRSFADNTYLSPNIRFQKEREHKLVDTGVYGFVRHPMYLGVLFWMIGSPLLVNSFYGLILGLLSVVALAIRIFGEEKMLVEELEGYKAYRKKVRYRLIPFVW